MHITVLDLFLRRGRTAMVCIARAIRNVYTSTYSGRVVSRQVGSFKVMM
jgi:hypothetical protein